MTQLTQIAPLPFLYVNNMIISVASNTTLSVSAGQIRDSGNSFDIVTAAPITIDATVNGINGLDTGTFTASTWYYVYALGDSQGYNLSGFIISSNATIPLIPSGYGSYRLLGYALSDGSTHFLPATVLGNGTHRRHCWTTGISVLSGGTVSSAATAIDCSGAVPAHADYSFLNLDVSFTANAAGDSVAITPTGLSASGVAVLGSPAASHAIQAQLQVVSVLTSSKPEISYQNSAASGSTSISVVGFEYNIA